MFKKIPFSYLWIFRGCVGDNIETVLDLGCGDGQFMRDLKGSENWDVYGVELHDESVEVARASGVYKRVYKGSVVKLPDEVKNRRYDVVVSSQVLEHLNKEDGRKALKKWEGLAEKRVVISTPVGFIEYDPIEEKEDNNPLQKHLSGWAPDELREVGYKVRGQGIRFIYGEYGLIRKAPALFSFFSFIGLIFAPLVYYFPKLGLYMIAFKEK